MNEPMICEYCKYYTPMEYEHWITYCTNYKSNSMFSMVQPDDQCDDWEEQD